MTKRKTKIIKDKKERGEWAESVFMARAAENGLPVSKPLGDSKSFDCVVGRPGKFVAVQVKCTVFRTVNGEGYVCSTCSSHKTYRAGAFDFLAAYAVLEDAWYIVPAKVIRGLRSICLCTPGGRYEQFREAWELLKEAAKIEEGVSGEPEEEPEPRGEGPTAARMRASFNFVRRYLDKGGRSQNS